jgi:SpoIVB peptidase S55
MNRASITALLAGLLLAFPAAAPATDSFPLENVRPGMTGTGRTVFEGTRIDEFSVEILGVLENALGPKHSVILARLGGGPLAKTGVISGMSGSPVFIEGKLVGAVAYSFPFGKEPIAGITPIGDMIAATSTPSPRAASTRFHPSSTNAVAFPLDRDSLIAMFARPLQKVMMDGAAAPSALASGALAPLALPLVFAGFDRSTFDWAQPLFSSLGFVPMTGGASGGTTAPVSPLPDLAPGAPIGVSLIEGDLDLSVTGTVTHIDGDRVYAFGHPFYNLGPTQFPMKKAYVYSVYPSVQQSWKIAAAQELVGTVEQDRTTAIAGRLGKAPRMIPVDIQLVSSRGDARAFHYRIVEDELFSPALAYVSLLSVLQGNERAFGTASVRVDGRLSLEGGRSIRVDDLFAAAQPSMQAAGLVAAPLAFLMANDFQKVSVERLEVQVSSFETNKSASLERAWIERTGALRPGATVPVKVALRTYRGEAKVLTLPIVIPPSAPTGSYSLLVSDAQGLTSLEQRELRQPFNPKDLDQLIRAINGLRRSNRVYVRLMRAGDGAVVAGEYLPALPSSVMSVLGTAEQGNAVVPIRTATVADAEITTEYAVSGSRLLSLAVER